MNSLLAKPAATAIALTLLCGALGIDTSARAEMTQKPVAAKAPTVTAVVVPNGLVVPVALDSELTSAKAAVGEEFPLHVTQDVIANGYVIVKVGALGAGVITAAKAASKGSPGSLTYEISYVQAVDGKKIKLSSTLNQEHNLAAVNGTVNDQTALAAKDVVASTATTHVLSQAGAMLGPLGAITAFAPNLFRGRKAREATVPLNTVISAFVAGTVHVSSSIKSAAGTITPKAMPTDDGFAH